MTPLKVVGTGMTPFGKHPDASLATLAGSAVRDCLATAELTSADVDAVFVSNAVGATVLGQEMVAGQAAVRGLDLNHAPVFNVENACASGQSAFHLACAYVRGGLAETVLVVGVERMTHPDKSRPMRALAGALDVAELGAPEDQPADRSIFMDLYAAKARKALDHGVTREDFADVVVKNQAHGKLNPRAQFGRDLTVDEVLRARLIVDPLTLLMCSPISDGAAAVLVTGRRPVKGGWSVDVLATTVMNGGDRSTLASATSRAAASAYDQAGVGPRDVSLLELHDATAPAELDLYEQLGLCTPGEAGALLRSGDTRLGGRQPVNASGGLIAKGHPGGATGVAQVVELAEQLSGRSGPRQVPDARIGLAHNAGGWIGDDNAAASVAILARVS